MIHPDSIPAAAATPGARQARGCFGVFFVLMLVVAALWGAAIGAFLWFLDDADEPIRALEEFRPKIGSKVYAADGELLGEFTVEARQLVSLGEIPLRLQKAFIATEDDEFYEHKGVRPLALLNVAFEALRTGDLRGASTITQQIVRNVETTGISKEVTLQRKLREMIVAMQLEREFTKDEILELYLNQIFLGVSAHGVEAAARQYFSKSVSDLTLGECALLAGLARSPNNNQPFRYPENARIRRDIVLAQMLKNGFITQEEHDAAVAESVAESVVTPEERAARTAEGKDAWAPNRFKAPYFVEEVRRFIMNPPAPHQVNANREELLEGGLEIHTTIDMRLQRAAEEVLLRRMDAFDQEKLDELRRRGREAEFIPVSGALVCLDNRPGFEGFVRAMVGGRDFDVQKFNNATQALRQPGSSIKPFVWLAAIDQGMTPSTIIVDEPFQRVDGMGRLWQPKNFDGKFNGPIPLRFALEKSVNIVSIKLVERLGMPLVRSYIRSAGFRQPIDNSVNLTLALGTPVTTVLDHATCYQTLALGGLRVDPVLVTEIKDRDGFVRYDYRTFRAQTRTPNALPKDSVYVVTHMLQGACQADPRLNHYPTGWRTADLKRPRAGKTGTTNDSKDAWFCGFTPQFTCVVWFGYEDNRSMGRGEEFTGGRIASPTWTEFMIAAHEGLPVVDFEVPPGVEFYPIDRLTGLAGRPSSTYREAFRRGTVPPTELPNFQLEEELATLLEKL